MISTLVLLGASGDLTGRLLLPAIGRLLGGNLLPDDFRVVGVAREEWDSAAFREHATERLAKFGEDLDPSVREDLVARLDYVRGDVTSAADLKAAVPADAPVIVYLALPNTLFDETLEALAEATVPEGSLVVVEKPFGEDLEGARRLNELVHRVVPEESVFRVDHFLAKSTVIDLLGLRFANRIFEPVWNGGHIERVDIVWDETLGLEGRAGYYDTAGALKDMLQNHLLQVLSVVAMEPPLSMSERDLRDRKVDVLRAVRPLSAEKMRDRSVRGRYTAGRIGDRDLPAYAAEDGVDPSRETETYAEVTLQVDNWRWAGVPFRLRSGKGLGENRREIRITFRDVPHRTFGADSAPARNVLHIGLGPDEIALQVNLIASGEDFSLNTAKLDLPLVKQDLEAYSLLLMEILQKDPTLAIRADEAEESWRIVEPVLAAWREGLVPLEEYPAGSEGPRPAFA